jgi:hypothetical protein
MALSVEHAGLLLLFQNRLELALELAQTLGLAVGAGGPATLENVDLTSAVPPEYRTDLVVRYHGGRRPLVVIVEVQRERDEDKRYSWPAYSVLLRARFRCDVLLLVLATKRGVARWCSRPIELGNGAVFRPTVLGPDLVPAVTDHEQAHARPELAVLSAMVHGRGEVGQAVAIGLAGLAAVERLEEERGMVYSDLILTALGEAARKAIEAMIPQGYKWQSDWVRKHRAEGRAEGKAEGQAEGEAKALVVFLEARGVAVADEDRERILGCTDLGLLERWLRRAATVAAARELFE